MCLIPIAQTKRGSRWFDIPLLSSLARVYFCSLTSFQTQIYLFLSFTYNSTSLLIRSRQARIRNTCKKAKIFLLNFDIN